MKIKRTNNNESIELPLQISVSFEKVFLMYKKYSKDEYKEHPNHLAAKNMVAEIAKTPALIDGFSDFTLFDTHKKNIDLLLNPLFPEPLLLNEIKSATIPFTFTSFKFTTRFDNIIKNAGTDFEVKIRNFEDDLLYIYACTMILGSVYGYHVDLKRPFIFDIPDLKSGCLKHYRAAFNNDFGEVIATENAPKITEEDYIILINNFDNIDIWKEKFPLNSYIYKGFGIMNLFDVTTDEVISNIRTNLLKSGHNLISELQKDLRKFYTIPDLKLGYSIFDNVNVKICETTINRSNSIILNSSEEVICDSYFCDGIMQTVFKNQESLSISDVEKYGRQTNKNPFYQNLKKQGIQSITLIPIKATENNDLALLEIASPRPFELNSVNLNKLKDIIPVFEVAVKRASDEYQNTVEALIQEHYTTIHPTVKWRFKAAADKYILQTTRQEKNIKLDEIIFKDVYPLFGQSDIKGSSIARNIAIKEDLTLQLSLAINVLNEAYKVERLPIYEELIFRVKEYLQNINKGLKAGDEIAIIDFLKRDIYPVFNHIKKLNITLNDHVSVYMNRLDKDLHVVYEKRKDYEGSVTLLNNKLAAFLDQKQEEAQLMFPHYFERYKTDGVEYNMYIGGSLTDKKPFDNLYLYNLRLWQLQTMFELENIAFKAREEMNHDLRVASLILVHSNPLSIKFRMDEKQFDVDGAYNIRYEIIKKRIDKAHIKNTTERITVPGKIAIVYSQESDAKEYLKYIHFLQSKKYLGKLEKLEIEDLQGVSGLKALRAEVIYNPNKEVISLNDLIEELRS
ncbi:GAF domain-containing protein [Polaribacter uvawellassae]|uniref:GAF domain-containing protein n=1 Tax=Polaribacter uvawellassae TaxID=3133495 RepID=UPI00321A85D9